MVLTVLVALLSLGAGTKWAPLYSGEHQIRVRPGETKAVELPVPKRLAGSPNPVTFTWKIIWPIPAPTFVFIEQCVQPERCYPAVMRPTGEGNGSLQSPFRVINKARQIVEIEFKYTLWDVK